jgi:hypothetical protein
MLLREYSRIMGKPAPDAHNDFAYWINVPEPKRDPRWRCHLCKGAVTFGLTRDLTRHRREVHGL